MEKQPAKVIYNKQEIYQKIKRIAYQIYENNVNESSIVLAGIASNGFILAEKLKNELEKISDINIILCKVEIDKRNPLDGEITTSIEKESYTNKSIVLVDDVLNSGTTLIYGVRHFLAVPLKQFKTAVLVDRSHKKFPVKADFKGVSLSTSLHERIEVVLDRKEDLVKLV